MKDLLKKAKNFLVSLWPAAFGFALVIIATTFFDGIWTYVVISLGFIAFTAYVFRKATREDSQVFTKQLRRLVTSREVIVISTPITVGLVASIFFGSLPFVIGAVITTILEIILIIRIQYLRFKLKKQYKELKEADRKFKDAYQNLLSLSEEITMFGVDRSGYLIDEFTKSIDNLFEAAEREEFRAELQLVSEELKSDPSAVYDMAKRLYLAHMEDIASQN